MDAPVSVVDTHCGLCKQELPWLGSYSCTGCDKALCAECITYIPGKRGYKKVCKACLKALRGRCHCDSMMPISLVAYTGRTGRGSVCTNCGRIWESKEIGTVE